MAGAFEGVNGDPGIGPGLSLSSLHGLALRAQPSPQITTVPLRPSVRASLRGDEEGNGLFTGPSIASRDDAFRVRGEPGIFVATRAVGCFMEVCSMAPGFICVPIVCDRDSAKNFPDVVEEPFLS